MEKVPIKGKSICKWKKSVKCKKVLVNGKKNVGKMKKSMLTGQKSL